MEKPVNSDQKHSLFAIAAAIAPVTQAASNQSWLATLVMASAALVVGRGCRLATGWVLNVQKLWGCVVISILMNWSTAYWEPMPFCQAVPLILLALAVWTVSVPGKAGRIGCVLLWPLLLLLGAVLLSGITEVELKYLQPKWQAPEFYLFPMLMLPFLAQGGGKNNSWKVSLGAVAVSVVTMGVLSAPIAKESASGIYELSRSLSLLGMAERFESLVAAAMTLGLFTSMTYLLEPGEGKNAWIFGTVAAGLYLLRLQIGGWILSTGSVLAWIGLPLIARKK